MGSRVTTPPERQEIELRHVVQVPGQVLGHTLTKDGEEVEWEVRAGVIVRLRAVKEEGYQYVQVYNAMRDTWSMLRGREPWLSVGDPTNVRGAQTPATYRAREAALMRARRRTSA